jgi:UDP-N-acetylmuramate--alanine ligase
MEISKSDTIHFIGIGGVGMSAIARVLLELGYKVTGSDLRESVYTIRLKDYGAKIFYEHAVSNIRLADVVVLSSAIKSDNKEWQEARNLGLKILHRAEMLAFLMTQFEKRIAVTGTHGKTTISAMISHVFIDAGKAPTYLVGSELTGFGSNAALGKEEYFIAEADESDGSFLDLDANIGVISNLEKEHMNYYKNEENLDRHFRDFISGVCKDKGYVVVNKDDEKLRKLTKDLEREKVLYYALDTPAEIMAQEIEYSPKGVSYNLIIEGKAKGRVFLNAYGLHNVSNSLAAVGMGLRENLTLEQIMSSLGKYLGTKRRMQKIGEVVGIKIFDDYAHHPTEIKTTLKSIKASMSARLICIFQPHRYSRTRNLFEMFIDAFAEADKVVLTEIYAADEDKIEGVSGRRLAEEIEKKYPGKLVFIEHKGSISQGIIGEIKKGDVVVTMGAGDINTVAKDIFLRLKKNYDEK